MTHHIVLKVAYDGSSYFGWQATKEGPSIEESLSLVLERILGEKICLRAASRTDRGVHARGQVVDFFCTHLPKDLSKLEVSLNQLLPKDIRCLSLSEVTSPDFHPTLSAKSKLYRYHVTASKVQKPQYRYTHWHVLTPLNISLMREACLALAGTHDFRGFCNRREDLSENTVRTLYSVDISAHDDDEIIFNIHGQSFLYKMVRNIVGTLLYIGNKKLDCSAIELAFSSRKRAYAGVTAPAHGLTLWQVNYEENPWDVR